MGKNTPVVSLVDLCKRHGIISGDYTRLRYSEQELLKLLDQYIRGNEARLEKAKSVYIEQRKKIEALTPSQSEWSFGKGVKPPEDWNFKAFKKRLIEKDNAVIKAEKLEKLDKNNGV